MNMDRPVRKPIKVKKCITILECMQNSVSSDKDDVKNMYNTIVEMMRHKNPEFVADSLEEKEAPEAHRVDPIQRVDQEVQVSMEEFNKDTETRKVSDPYQNEAVQPVRNDYTVPCYFNGSSTLTPKKTSNSSMKSSNSKLRSPFDPSVVIKVEDSGSDESNFSEEMLKTENLVHRMMAPCSAPMNSMSPKSFLHYVVIENLPTRATADEVVNELFIGLLGINREDVTGITVHNDKTESIAQIYFKDLKYVQKILVFSGKLVFKGRVITSKVGMS